MKVLVVGSGGREHAIIKKLAESEKVTKLFAAPGNAGISSQAECVNIKAMDIEGVVNFSLENKLDMVVVAPDDPLSAGMVDRLQAEGIRAFGPTALAAEIESSKAFSKKLMKKHGIPTADFEVFDSANEAIAYINEKGAPIVVKASGLALGKGVVVAETVEQAIEAVHSIMDDKVFGSAGDSVVIEECLFGNEVSVLAFTDGETLVPMVSAQDHKRVYDGNKGPNTGGMGTFSPSMHYTEDMAKTSMKEIFIPTVMAMNSEGRKFKGVLYFGLIITEKGIKVIEYNARFGDPETQVVLPLLKTDLYDIFDAVIDERLADIDIKWDDNACVCVMLASGGYPVKYQSGKEIFGIDDAEALKDITVYHSGTKLEGDTLLTAGGRVLGVTAVGRDMEDARQKSYAAAKKIRFEGMHFRTDIGKN